MKLADKLWAHINAGNGFSQSRDPETGEFNAASHPYTNGQALAIE